ncbi:MAG: hypothetical protein IT368_04105 [Candidatus Hydrogenedentes bacterium]|nr:hypothetical protein [Candidatus Hydrogenedentota bacterium]
MIRTTLRIALAAALLMAGTPLAAAQEAPPAPDPAAVDSALQQLILLDPQALVARIAELRAQADADAAKAAEFRQQAETLDQQVSALGMKLDILTKQVESLNAVLGVAAPAPPSAEMQAAAPEMAPEAEMAAANLTNFADHVAPILQKHCARCHNQDTRKSGLSVALHAQILEGGSSGPVIVAGDPDGSRLFRLISHQEEPYMPPSGTQIPAEEIEVIRKWIADGAPADASAKPVAAKTEESAPAGDQPTFVAATFADTPPMPEVQLAAATSVGARAQVARALDTSPRAPLLAVGSDKQILIYNIETFSLLGALPFPEGDVFTLTFSLNGELLLAGGGEEGYSGTCALYNVRTGERLGTFGEFWDTVLAADISPDHRMIAVGGPEKKVKVYSVETGEQLYEISDHNDWIYAVRFTPDGEVLATADRAGGLYLWQAANGRAVEQLRGHEGAIHALEYTYDSAYLASAGADGTVHIWDTWQYTKVRSFKAHGAPVLNLDISASNQILTTSADRTTKLWDLEGKELATFQGLNDWGYQARFAEEGGLALAGSWTGDVILWNTQSGEVVQDLEANPAES